MTQKQRLKIYERFMHCLQMHAEVVPNADKIKEAISLMCDWSYAHRVGNGEYSEREQQRIVDQVVARMERF